MSNLNEVQKSYICGVTNFTENIKPIMKKLRDKKKITKEEGETIVNYYLEVVGLLMSFWIDVEKVKVESLKVV